MPARRRMVIMGAAGRDFHNFQCCFREEPSVEVIAFTATQIPSIAGRRYPASLAGPSYPQGIPIYPEAELGALIARHHIDEVVFSYSDVANQTVMTIAQMVLASGANFTLLGGHATMLPSRVPVVAVCAVRTGCGKSAVTRRVVHILRQRGLHPVVIRHPMPYGDLEAQQVQRFATFDDLDRHHCTIEEREEYEPHLEQGTVVYAGVDYAAILRAAEEEAEVIVWDGGNNDLPFLRPDVHICLVDPHRPGHETLYYPGTANLLLADVVVIAKEDTADPAHIQQVKDAVRRYNPRAAVIDAASPPQVSDPQLITGKRVLVVEDGPTLTHGGMAYGAGLMAAEHFGAAEVVDPRPYVQGAMADTLRAYPALRRVLPAMGYGAQQMADLEATINAVPCESVLFGTPVDLRRILTLHHPAVRVRYEVQEIGSPTLADVLPHPLVRKASPV
ncbi:MAG TPA: cyclic 2,3-diphosphoglycerate synthase [Candidatus Tectomicrobia bacterium]